MSSVVGLFVLAAGDMGSDYLDEASLCGTFYGSKHQKSRMLPNSSYTSGWAAPPLKTSIMMICAVQAAANSSISR